MTSSSKVSQPDMVEKIAAALSSVAPTLGAVGPETRLMGEHAALDSITFITLLVRLEQDLDNTVDLSTSFLGQPVEDVDHPFRTVDSLAAHILELMAIRR